MTGNWKRIRRALVIYPTMRCILLVCFLFTSCPTFCQEALDTTFRNILNDPDKYDGKEVEIYGYINFEFEGDCIFLDTVNLQNRIWVGEIEPELLSKKYFGKLNGRRVIIKGKYDKDNHGHMGLFKGAITHIVRLDLY
jgi:hypothetical protein